MRKIRLTAAVCGVTLLASVVGCSTTAVTPVATVPSTFPVATYPATTTVPVASLEYGRITNIEYMPAGTNAPLSGNSIVGAVVGGLAGAALGSQIGGGAGRTAATVLGGVAGAALGSQIARNAQGVTTQPGYRITMLSDQGVTRTFEVTATGDLHVGDRVRVENNVIYRA